MHNMRLLLNLIISSKGMDSHCMRYTHALNSTFVKQHFKGGTNFGSHMPVRKIAHVFVLKSHLGVLQSVNF